MQPRFRLSAILLGWAISTIAGGVVSKIAGLMLSIFTSADDPVAQAQLRSLTGGASTLRDSVSQVLALVGSFDPSPSAIVVSSVVSMLFVISGGYLAGRGAPHSEMKNAVAVGVLCLITGAVSVYYSIINQAQSTLTVVIWMPVALAIPMAWLGGLLAENARNKTLASYNSYRDTSNSIFG